MKLVIQELAGKNRQREDITVQSITSYNDRTETEGSKQGNIHRVNELGGGTQVRDMRLTRHRQAERAGENRNCLLLPLPTYFHSVCVFVRRVRHIECHLKPMRSEW